MNMRVFDDVEDSERQALKPLEGAAGVFGAWRGRGVLVDECVGTVQAVANLLAAVGATQGEVDAAIGRMDERNRDLGRL